MFQYIRCSTTSKGDVQLVINELVHEIAHAINRGEVIRIDGL
jgi:nucleoid DNA-binding protein